MSKRDEGRKSLDVPRRGDAGIRGGVWGRGGEEGRDDGIMDHDTDGDGAINLSTSQRPSAATTPNGDTPTYGQDQQDNDQVGINP
ncbi:hypothetical protein G5I_11751 [Acromyrmex echinatior]|uniref:Uncharacterized protein n=1 Tax=Acromyrmex echinatior TaxID=103372 RepID=F4X0H2_ACREC|nr:hypothetical protein G5I_11751 [Acromyrmex echinatior]